MSEASPRTDESRAAAPSAGERRSLLLAAALSILGATLHALLIPDSLRERSDLPHYLESAVRWAIDGAIPYREIPFEYPPAALLFLCAPIELVAAGFVHFEEALVLVLAPFDALALFAAFFIAQAAARMPVYTGIESASLISPPTRASFRRGITALAFAWLALFLCGSLLFTRFDLAPAALLVLSVALVASAPVSSGALLGAATALKLYPFWAAPALAFHLWRKHKLALALLAGVAVGLVISVPAMLPAGSFALSFLGYHSARGLQFQSLWGSLYMVAAQLGWTAIELKHSFGAEEIAGAPAWMGMLASALSIGWMVLCGIAARRLPARLAALSAICGFVAFGKIGSPQFSIVLAPLAAGCLFDAPLAALAILAAIALGAWQFPFHLKDLMLNQGPWAVLGLLRMLLIAGAGISLVYKTILVKLPRPKSSA